MDSAWQWLMASQGGVAAASPNPAHHHDRNDDDYQDDNDRRGGRGGKGRESLDSREEFLEKEDEELKPPPSRPRPRLDPPEDDDYFTDGGYQTDDFLPTLLENRVLDCMANTGAPFSNMLDYIDSPPGLGTTKLAETEQLNIGMFHLTADDNSLVVEEEFSDKEERIQRIRSYMKRLEKRETIKTPSPITLFAQPIPLHDDGGHEIPFFEHVDTSGCSDDSNQSEHQSDLQDGSHNTHSQPVEISDFSNSNQSQQSDQGIFQNQHSAEKDCSDSSLSEHSDQEGSHSSQPVEADEYCSDSNPSEQSDHVGSQNQPVVADEYYSDSNQSEPSGQGPSRHKHSVVVVNGCSDSYQSEQSDQEPSLHKQPSVGKDCSESNQSAQSDGFLDPRTPITHATSGSETDSPSVPEPPSRVVVNQTPSALPLFRLGDISFRIPDILPISRNSKPPVVNKTMSDFYARNRSRLISGRSEQSQESSPDISTESLQTEQPKGDDERVEVVFTDDKELPKDDQFQFGHPEGMVFVPQCAPSPVEEASLALNIQMRRSSIMEYNTTSDESSANMQDSVPDETPKHRNIQQLDRAQTQSKCSGSSRPDLLVLEPTSVQAGHETHPIDLVEIEAEEVVMPSCLPPARTPARSPLRSPLRKRPRYKVRRRATRQQEFSPKIEMPAPLENYDSPNAKKNHNLHIPTSPKTEKRHASTSRETKDVTKIESSCSEDSFSTDTEMDNSSSDKEIVRARADFRVTDLVSVELEDAPRYCPERFTFAIEPTFGDVIEILSSDWGGHSSSPSLLRRSDKPGTETKTADLIQAQKHNMTSCCNPASSSRRAVQKRVRRPTFAERIEPTMEDLCCIKSEQQLGPSIHATSPTRWSKVARPTFAERIEPTLEDIPCCCPFSPNDEHKVINVEVLNWERRNYDVTGKPRPTLAERIEPTLEDIPCCQFGPAGDQAETSAYHVQTSMQERPRGVSTKARVATGRGPTKGPITVIHCELDPEQSFHNSPRGQRKFDPPTFSDVERRQHNVNMDVRPRQKNLESKTNTKSENELTIESSFLLHHRIDKAVIRLCDQSEYVHNEESMLKPTSDAEVRRRLWKPPPDCMAPQRTKYPLEPLASDKPVIDLSTHNLDPPGSHPDPPALTKDWARPSPERDTKSNMPAVGGKFSSKSTGAKSIGNVTFGRTQYNDSTSNRRTGVPQDQHHRLASVQGSVSTPLKMRQSYDFGSAIRGLDIIAQRLESDLGISSLSGVGRTFSRDRSRPSPFKSRISGVPASSASVRDRMANLRVGRAMYASDRSIRPGSRTRDWRSTMHATRPTERASYSRSGNRANVETLPADWPSRSQSNGRRQLERERTVGRAKTNSTPTRLRPLETDAHHSAVSSSSEATTDSFDGHVSILFNRMKENTRSARSTKAGAVFGDGSASSLLGTSKLSQLRESVNADRKKLVSRFSYLLTDTKEAGARPENESSMETSILRHTQAAISQSGVLMFRPNINVYHGRTTVNPRFGDEGSPLSIENDQNENRQDRDCSEERTEEREDAPRNNADENKVYPDDATMRDGGARNLFAGPPTIDRSKSISTPAVHNEPEIIQVEDTLNEHKVIHLEGLDEDFHWRFLSGWKQSAFRRDQIDHSSPQEDIDKKLYWGILKTHFEAADAKLAATLIGEEQFKKFEPAVCAHDDDDGMDEEMKNLQVSEELLRQELELVQTRVALRRRQLLPCPLNGFDGNTEKVVIDETQRQNRGAWDAREPELSLENQRGKVSILVNGVSGPTQVTNNCPVASDFGADMNSKEPSKIKNQASQQTTRMEPEITFVEEPGSAEMYLKATGDNSTKALQLSGADLAIESGYRHEAFAAEEIAGTDPPGISCKKNCPSVESTQHIKNVESPRSRLPVTAHFQRQAEVEPSGDKVKPSEAIGDHLKLSRCPLTSSAYGDLFQRHSSPPRASEIEDSKVQVMHHQYEEVVEVCVDDSDSTEYSEVEDIEVVFVEQSFASTDVFTYGERGGIVFDWVRDESAFDEKNTKSVPQTISPKKERRVEIISVVSMEDKCSGTRGPKATLSFGRVEVPERPRIIPSSHPKSSCIQNAVDLTLPSLNHDAETVARERSYPGNDSARYNHSRDDTTPGNALVARERSYPGNDSARYNHSRDDTTPGNALVQNLKQVEGYFWGTALPSSPSAQKQDHPRIARIASDPPLSRQGEDHKQFASTVAQPFVAADPPAAELSAQDDCLRQSWRNPLVASTQDPPSLGPVIIRIESHSSQDPPANSPQIERMISVHHTQTTREADSAKQEEQIIPTNGRPCRSSHVDAKEKQPSLSQSSKVLQSSDRRATRKANSPKKTKRKDQENTTANGLSIDSPRSRSTRESIIDAMISDGTSALEHAESPRKTKSKASSTSFSSTRPIIVNDKVRTSRCHLNAKESQAPESAVRNDSQCKPPAKTTGKDALEESINKLFAILEDSEPSMSVSSNSGPIMPTDDRANKDTLGGKNSTPNTTAKYKRSRSTMMLEFGNDGAREKRRGDKTETEMDSASESTITLLSPEVLALIKKAKAKDSERRDSDSTLTFDLQDDEASRGGIPERPRQERKTTLHGASSMDSSSDVSTIFSPKVLAAILKAKGLRVLDGQDSRSTLTFDVPDDLTIKKEPATIKLDRDETEASRLAESSHSSTSSPPGPNVLAIVQKARMLAADCSRQDTRSTLTFTLPQQMEEVPESEGADHHHQPPRKSPSKKGKKKISKSTAGRKRASRNKSDVTSPLNMTIVTCGSNVDNDSNSTLTLAFPKDMHPSRETKESIENATETILLPTGEIRTSCIDQRRQRPSISERNPRIGRHADKGNGKESGPNGRHESGDGFFNMLKSGGRILAASLARQRVDANLSDVDAMSDGDWSIGAEASQEERYDIDGAAQEWMNRHPDESFSKIDSKTVPCSGAVLLSRHKIQPDDTTPPLISPASETKTESPSRTRIMRLQKILGAKSRLARKSRSPQNDNSTRKQKALASFQLPGFVKVSMAPVIPHPPQQGHDAHATLVKTPSESPRSVRLRIARRRLGMVHEANSVGDSATAAATNLKSRIASIEKCLDHSPEPRVKDEKRKTSPTAKNPVPTAAKGEDEFDETDKANIVGDSGAATAANVKSRIAAIEKCLDHSPEPRVRDEVMVQKSPPAKIPVTVGEDKFDEADPAGSAEVQPAITETTETAAAADNQRNGSDGGTDSGIEE